MNTYRLILSTIAIILFTQCAKRTEDGKESVKIINQVPFSEVKVQDLFWSPRIETNRKVTIPFDFQKCKETGRLDNFAIAVGLKPGKFKGTVYDDLDVFKMIEGASYSIQQTYEPELDTYLDSLISWIASVQEPDGYLYTARTINPDSVPNMGGSERWQKIHLYKPFPDGYSGDEDQGLMGTLAVLMKLGLFQMTGGVEADPIYEISSPIFSRVEIMLNPNYYAGESFIIEAEGASGHDYVIEAAFNDIPIESFQLRHSQISKGGALKLKRDEKQKK